VRPLIGAVLHAGSIGRSDCTDSGSMLPHTKEAMPVSPTCQSSVIKAKH
jgi:hypothetical protein